MTVKYEKIQNIPLDLIDEPSVAIRSRIDDSSLSELADSIRSNGLIQPIILRKRGERYEIVAGHRRFLAFRQLGRLTIPALVRSLNDAGADIVKLSENFYREDVNVVDEAKFLASLIERHRLTVSQLAEKINRSETYIRERLDMVNWDPLILEYLYGGKIIFTAAKYLAAIDNEAVRRSWLDIAVRCGITTAQAKAWYEQYQKGALPLQPSPEAVAEVESGGLGVVIEKECGICGEKGNLKEMKVIMVHPDCEEFVRYQRKFGNLPVIQQK